MNIADLPQVEALDRICFRTPWPEGSFRYELRPDSNSICLVAESDEAEAEPQIIGMVVVWLIADVAEVATLAVAPQERGRGIARKLLASALQLAWQAGACKSILEVRVSNTAALHLYYGFGYQAVGLRPGYYEDTHEDALLLTLDPLDLLALQALEKT
jgi:ribosomal-protein-alanine N-acetyltransferase